MGGRPRKKSVRARLRGSEKTRIRMGDEEHEQSQREHLEKILPRCAGLFARMHTTWRRKGSPSTGNL